MSAFALNALKIFFLALLYLFVYRALRVAILDVRAASRPTATGGGQGAGRGTGPSAGSARSARGRPPRSIVVTEEGGAARTVELEGSVRIGRGEGCRIRIADTYVSTFHARVFDRDGAWFVEDLGSTNGTFLNDVRVTSPAALRAGDRVRIGRTILELSR